MTVAAPAELTADAGDCPVVAGGSAAAGAGEDDPADGGTAAETAFGVPCAALGRALAEAAEAGREEDGAGEADGPPRLVT